MKLEKMKLYLEILVLCGGIVTGVWFSVVKPALQRIIHTEVKYIEFCLDEIMTDAQRLDALEKLELYKKTGTYTLDKGESE